MSAEKILKRLYDNYQNGNEWDKALKDIELYANTKEARLPETHVHIKSGNLYGVFGFGSVNINGTWNDAVFYTDSSGNRYCRSQIEFDEKFKVMSPEPPTVNIERS